jgi:glycosyltransferase involved in cell wall biosynthesis
MAAGLPMACSRMGPMPEVLGDGGVYFDPEDSNDISSALRKLIHSPYLRAHLAEVAFSRAKQYAWGKCSDMTFDFLSEIAQRQRGINERTV